MAASLLSESSYEAQELSTLLVNTSPCPSQIANACQAVESYMYRHSTDQAKHFYTITFPVLLRGIFGFEDVSQPSSPRAFAHSGGWIEQASAPGNEQAANALISLLSPSGVLFSSLFSADEENLVRYVFPVERLPNWIRPLLQCERGLYILSEVSPLFKGRLKEDVGGGLQVQLNVFEYYMFWFAYYSVCKDNSNSNGSSNKLGARKVSRSRFEKWTSSIPGLHGTHHRLTPRKLNSSPYLQLVQLYLHYFVPVSALISFPSPFIATPSPRSMLLRPSFTGDYLMLDHAELVFHTFVQFWLVDDDPSPLSLSVWQSLGVSCPLSNAVYNYAPPSATLAEALRIFVNYLNSSLHLTEEELNSIPFNESQTSLRRRFASQADSARFRASSYSPRRSLVVLPPWLLLLQRPLYRFILRAFRYWPMCASVKKAVQILDVWLDYLEPWNTVPEREARPVVSEDLYLEAENKLLRDPARSLLLKQNSSSISGRAVVQGSTDEAGISCQYSVEWQDYVLANYLFYTSLVVHFLIFAHKFVHIDPEAVIQMTHKVLNFLISSKELLGLLRRVDSVYQNVISGSALYSFDGLHKVVPAIRDQLQDWEDGSSYFEKESESIRFPSKKGIPELKFFSPTDNGGHRMLQLLIMRAEAEIQTGSGEKILPSLQSLEVLKGLASKIFGSCGMSGSAEIVTAYLSNGDNVPTYKPNGEDVPLMKLPGLGRHTWADVKYKGDWMRRPIGNSEVAWLARLLVRISDWLNKKLGLDHQENTSCDDNIRDDKSYESISEPTFAEIPEDVEEISLVAYLSDVMTWINLFSTFFSSVVYGFVFLLQTVQRVLRRNGWRINLRIMAEKKVLIFIFICISLGILRKYFLLYSDSLLL